MFKINVNEIFVMVFIIAINIVRNIFVSFEYTIVADVSFNFYFLFTRHGDGTARIAILVTKNNHGVLLVLFTIDAIYTAVLENQIVHYSKMIRLKVNSVTLTIIFLMMLIALQYILEILLLFLTLYLL